MSVVVEHEDPRIDHASIDRAASSGLTMLQRERCICTDPEQPVFINSKPSRGLLRHGESPLSGALHFTRKRTGERLMGGLFEKGGGRAGRALRWPC
jgi:hypothetical protein